MDLPDLFHIPKSVFFSLKEKLSKKQTIAKEEVDGLVNWEPQDNEIYLPVDMHAADEDLDDFEEALTKLGPQVTAQCFVQAFERFQKKKHLLPADKQMDLTCKQWKETYGNQNQDDQE